MCARASAFRRSCSVRRRTTSRRNSMNRSMRSSSGSSRGRPSAMARVMMPNDVCSWVCLCRLLSSTSGTSPRRSSITMRMPSRSDSSRRSAMPSITLSRASSAIFLSSRALLTWYGISVTTIAVRSPLPRSSYRGARPHGDAPAAGVVRLRDAGPADDEPAGREIGAGDQPQQLAHLLEARRIGMFRHPDGAVDHLPQVVRGDIGRHADRDAGRAVHQQVGVGRPAAPPARGSFRP